MTCRLKKVCPFLVHGTITSIHIDITDVIMELAELNAVVDAFLDRIIVHGKTFDAVLKGVKVEPIETAGTLRCSIQVRKDLQNRMGNLHGGATGKSKPKVSDRTRTNKASPPCHSPHQLPNLFFNL